MQVGDARRNEGNGVSSQQQSPFSRWSKKASDRGIEATRSSNCGGALWTVRDRGSQTKGAEKALGARFG